METSQPRPWDDAPAEHGPTPVYTRSSLIAALRVIRSSGWIASRRQGNAGGVGNTLEDLLGVKENNIPLANCGEWELKCHRAGTGSLTTLFHMEPSPRALRFVPSVLLTKYGWPHKKAGAEYPPSEMGFRQTINATSRTDRAFGILVERSTRKVVVSFDASAVDPRHQTWLMSVQQRAGLGELSPQPYWGFSDLHHKAGTKLLNCVLVYAEQRRVADQEQFWYTRIQLAEGFSFDKLLAELEAGNVLIDFDARTGHNHGTKFRLRPDRLSHLYERVEQIT